MFIFRVPGLGYASETADQIAERDRRIAGHNARETERLKSEEKQRLAPMRSMQRWAAERGIRQPS